MPRVGGAADGPRGESFSLIFSADEQEPHRRIMLFVAPPGSVSDAMVAAIEREFSWISVRHVQDIKIACMPFDLDVQLILVDRSLMRGLQPWLPQLARVHPSAGAAVMAEARLDCSEDLIRIVGSGAVRGVLPIEVNLDIWLSIIRIMLKGGEYFPSALFQKLQRLPEPANAIGVLPQLVQEVPQSEQWSHTMDGRLTSRELEVLAMVARGQQNKIIAADLGLSEHTVKIHLHNIIRKLGVHNRTEAAAKYFERANQEEGDHDPAEPDIATGPDTPSAA